MQVLKLLGTLKKKHQRPSKLRSPFIYFSKFLKSKDLPACPELKH